MKVLRGLLLSTVTALIMVACGDDKPEQMNPGGVSTAPEPEAAADLPASAVAQMKVLMAEKAARTPAQRKISSQLLYAKTNRFAALKRPTLQKGETQPAGLRSLMRYDDQGRVLCDVKGDVDAGLQRQIEIAGGAVVAASAQYKSARAWLPLNTLESLASQTVVKSIHPAYAVQTHRADAPYGGGKFSGLSYEQRVANTQAAVRAFAASPAAARPVPTINTAIRDAIANAGSATSEGSKAHGADRARKFYNTDGTGIRVGVLSDSDDLKEASIASGDLPVDTFTIPGQDGRPGTGEGTAIMELVHDVAPGAKLFFASAFNSPESFADNIRRLRFEFHCDVIVDDVQYFFENPYIDDIVAAAVDDVTADGGLYFSSAGNSGNFDDGTSSTWEGDFKSGGVLATLPTGYRVHDFGKKVISNRIEADGGPLFLHWSDPATLDNPIASNDYDLFILSPDLREVLVASTDIQDGTGLPFEFLGFIVPAGFRVVVAAKPDAYARAIRLELSGGEFGLSTTGSVYGHAAAKQAFAVGAVDAAEAAGGEFSGGATTPVEIFSSDGNRTAFYDRLGAQLGSGEPTFAGSAGEVRKKPEVAAADGVSTTLPSNSGLNPFFGTSAAVGHAGAIAALIKSAVPTADATKIYNALKSGALDIEAVGVDVDSGNGVLSVSNSLQKAGAKPAVFLDLGTVTATASSGNAIKPGGGGSLKIQLLNNGGAPATAVMTTLSSSTPGVTVTSARSSYANIAPSSSALNITPFTIAVGSTVPCGTRIQLTLSVAFSGRGTNPTAFNIPVQTGSPGLGVTTAYPGSPVAIPDGDPAGVDIPLAISAGPISQVGFSIDGAACSATVGSTTVGVDHTWVGDLVFKLRSPSGTTVTMINRAGGELNSANNFCQTVLQDGAANSIQTVQIPDAPYTGTFAPANSLSAFTGENATGTWVLNVSDNADFDTGTVRNFSVKVAGFSCTP
jgi:subtilisin-like proprotein convertase family protein